MNNSKKFEYKIVKLHFDRHNPPDSYMSEELSNMYEKEGWEFVGKLDLFPDSYQYIFKRKKRR